MIVIADTSAISALAEIGEIRVSPRLYGTILVPETVRQECLHPRAPANLAPLFTMEGWLRVVPDPDHLLPEVAGLDPGEAAAITLASQHRMESLLIIDDADGRRLSMALHLRITGTAGVLYEAARAGLLDFEEAVIRLRGTTFRISSAVLGTLRQQLKSIRP